MTTTMDPASGTRGWGISEHAGKAGGEMLERFAKSIVPVGLSKPVDGSYGVVAGSRATPDRTRSDREATPGTHWETNLSGFGVPAGRKPQEGQGFDRGSLGVLRVWSSGTRKR